MEHTLSELAQSNLEAAEGAASVRGNLNVAAGSESLVFAGHAVPGPSGEGSARERKEGRAWGRCLSVIPEFELSCQ